MWSKRIVVFLFAVLFFISLQSGFTEGEEVSKTTEFKLGQGSNSNQNRKSHWGSAYKCFCSYRGK